MKISLEALTVIEGLKFSYFSYWAFHQLSLFVSRLFFLQKGAFYNLLFLEILYSAEILEGKLILIYAEKEKLVNMSMT